MPHWFSPLAAFYGGSGFACAGLGRPWLGAGLIVMAWLILLIENRL
jgi:hypothetical protein